MGVTLVNLSDDNIEYWIRLFTKVNEDCRRTGETVRPLSDYEYYADQIEAMLFTEDYEACLLMARAMTIPVDQL